MGRLYMRNNVISQSYFNERLYDLFLGLQHEFVSIEGELNYRLRFMYNIDNMVPRNTMFLDHVAA